MPDFMIEELGRAGGPVNTNVGIIPYRQVDTGAYNFNLIAKRDEECIGIKFFVEL